MKLVSVARNVINLLTIMSFSVYTKAQLGFAIIIVLSSLDNYTNASTTFQNYTLQNHSNIVFLS